MNLRIKQGLTSFKNAEGDRACYKRRTARAFTLIEILLVVGILAILITITLPLSLDFYKSQQLDTNTQGIIQTLRRAQLKAMAIEDDSKFGVYLTNDSYILFKGNSYAGREIQYDEVSDLPPILTISGLSEVVFSKVEGAPDVVGNILISSDIESRAININEVGRINLE